VMKRQNVYLTGAQLHALARESGRYGSLVLLLGTAGLRWAEAAALRVSDIDFLRRRIELHRNAVTVGGRAVVGTLKSGKARTVPLAGFVVDELTATCVGKDRDELIWPSATGGYLRPPGTESWLAGAVARCQKADPTFPWITAHALRPYGGLAGDLGGRQREGGSTHVGTRLGGDDARRVCRSVRGRSHRRCRTVR